MNSQTLRARPTLKRRKRRAPLVRNEHAKQIHAPGIVTPPNLSRAPTARLIAFDQYLLGAALSCSGNLARAFSPLFGFRFVTWGFAPGWFEDAPLALTSQIRSLRQPELRMRTHF